MIAMSILILLIVLLVIGSPIGVSMLITGTLGLYWIGGWEGMMAVLSTSPRESGSVYEFLTIPMFLLMAEFVLRSGVADDLFETAAAWFGRVRGGLGIATAISGAGFGAICGSSTAAAATLSSTSLPAMLKQGYKLDMAAGVVAISGTLSMLIPPSVAMVLYALLADVSIAKMLVAGIIPGALVAFTIALTVYVLAWHNPECAPLGVKVSWAEKFRSLRLVGPMLILLMSVTGVIYGGVATPTEASALGAFVAGILYFKRGRRTLPEVYSVLARATRSACMIGLILIGAHVFTTFFALTQTTQAIVAWVGGLNVSVWVLILSLVVTYIILGCFMDQFAILVLTIPVLSPLLHSLGVDLVWFGIIVIVTAELGMVMPPLGLNAFVVSKYTKIPVSEVFRGIWPHVIAHLIAIGLLLGFPVLTMWLPSIMK